MNSQWWTRLLERCSAQILTEALHCFHESLQGNARMVPELGHDRFHSESYRILCLLIILHLDAISICGMHSDTVVNKP
jgi:hypothetical protein